MHLELLQDTPNVLVYYDSFNDWLFVDWYGDLTLPLVQAGCLTIAQCFLKRSYTRILNNNTDVRSMSADVPLWLAREYLPHLGLAGIEYLAWVRSSNLLLKGRTNETVRQADTPVITLFDDLAEAYEWLQHTRFSHLNRNNNQLCACEKSTAETQVELVELVAALVKELRQYQEVAGRATEPAM